MTLVFDFIFSMLGKIVTFMMTIVIWQELGLTLGQLLIGSFVFLLAVYVGVTVARRGSGGGGKL